MILRVNSSIHTQRDMFRCMHTRMPGHMPKTRKHARWMNATATHAHAVYIIYAHGTHAQQPKQPRYPDNTSKYENRGVPRCLADCVEILRHVLTCILHALRSQCMHTFTHRNTRAQKCRTQSQNKGRRNPKKDLVHNSRRSKPTITRRKWNSRMS